MAIALPLIDNVSLLLFHFIDTHFLPPLHTRQAGIEDQNTGKTTTRPSFPSNAALPRAFVLVWLCCAWWKLTLIIPVVAAACRLLPSSIKQQDQERGRPFFEQQSTPSLI